MTCRQLDQNLSGHFCAPDQYNPVSLKNSELKFSFSAAASQPRLWWPVCVSRVPLSCSLGCLLGCGGVVRAQERCCLTAIILTLVSLHHRLDLPGFVGRALSFHRFLWDPSPTSALLLPRTTASCPPPDDLSESFQHFSGAHLSPGGPLNPGSWCSHLPCLFLRRALSTRVLCSPNCREHRTFLRGLLAPLFACLQVRGQRSSPQGTFPFSLPHLLGFIQPFSEPSIEGGSHCSLPCISLKCRPSISSQFRYPWCGFTPPHTHTASRSLLRDICHRLSLHCI